MAAPIDLPVDALVLMGLPGISNPGDWYLARVLWTNGIEVLVHQEGIAGSNPHRALLPITSVRAVGDLAFLSAFKVESARAVAELTAAVAEAETALGRARDAVWIKLDEIGATRPGIETASARATRRRKAARARAGMGEAA